jgi:hypothetical protein
MVNNFQEVITSLQFEIDQSLAKIDFKKTLSKKQFILEQAASEMLHVVNLKKSKRGSKPYLSEPCR